MAAAPADVNAAYAHCRAICETEARTFSLACRLLPAAKRSAIWPIYAFCRYADDLVDRGDPAGAEAALATWRDELQQAYAGRPRHRIMVAYADVLRRYPLPLQPALALLDGMAMDLTVTRYQHWSELAGYCYRVAATVGLLVLPVLGYQSPRAADYAMNLGIAMQLTNILRDVGEDARRNRIYLPQDDLHRFGYTPERLMAGVVDQSFRRLMRFEIARARTYYRRAAPGIGLLAPDARLTVHLASVLYSQILNRIERNDYDVFSQRARLSLAAKLLHGLLAMRRLPPTAT